MQVEDRAISENGGKSPAGEGAGSDRQLASIAQSIDAIKGVVSDLVTKVSDIERSTQERQDLADIMRYTSPQPDPEELPQYTRKPPQNDGKPPEVNQVVANLENTLKKTVDSLNRRMDDVVSQMQVRQLEATKPEFNTTIRPLAFQISKEPGMNALSVDQITSVAEGRLALKKMPDVMKQIEQLKAENEELKSRAVGDKPGLFVGISEPPKKMDQDEAFEDAWEKSGANKILR